MKIKNVLIYFSSMLLVSIAAGKSFASVGSKFSVNGLAESEIMKETEEQKIIGNIQKNLTVEEAFEQGGMNYTIYKGLRALTGKESAAVDLQEDKKGNASMAVEVVNKKEILLDKGVFKVYFDSKEAKNTKSKVSSNGRQSSKVESMDEKALVPTKSSYKVAFNNKTKKFAVITGNMIVKIDPKSGLKLPDASFRVVKSYEKLGLYVVKIPENMQFKDAKNKLIGKGLKASNLDVGKNYSANVEVLENFKTPM